MRLFVTTCYLHTVSLHNVTCGMRYRHPRRRQLTTKAITVKMASAIGETSTRSTEIDSATSTTINHPKDYETNSIGQRKHVGPSVSAEIHKGPAILLTSHSIRSRPQPNLLYIPGLRSLPFWTQQQVNQHQQQEGNHESITNRVAYGDPTITAIVEHFDSHYESILHEYQSNYYNGTTATTTYVNSGDNNDTTATSDNVGRRGNANNDDNNDSSSNEHSMHLLNKGGKWDWRSYMTKGNVLDSSTDSSSSSSFHKNFPKTSAVLEALRNNSTSSATASIGTSLLRNQLLEYIPFGYVFFSTLHEQTNILPHTSPINFRLRIHVPISVPKQPLPGGTPDSDSHKPTCGIRVGNTVREWFAGKSLVLDDSYEHEVWNNHQPFTRPPTGTTISSSRHGDTQNHRVVLLVDIWHPDITLDEREEICYMFQTAKDQGWLSK